MSEHAAHAKLSPSGAARWMRCPGSTVLEASIPDRGSIYADEGTAAHTLAAMCLQGTVDCDDFLGEFIRVGERRFEVTDDMIGHVQKYVDYVRKRAEGKMLLVEQRVPIGHITGEHNAFGTADAIIIDAEWRAIEVIDLKYGMGVEVEAEGNEQAQMYALGALEECSLVADFDHVRMTIFQPRIREKPSVWRTKRAEVERFGNEAAAAADTCRAAASTAKSLDWDEEYLKPGDKQCKFCKAKATCPALRAEMFDVVGASPATADDFALFVPEAPSDETGDNWLAVVMSKVDLIEGYCKAVRGEVERRLLRGDVISGFKLVQGRQGPRKWTNADEAEMIMKPWLKVAELYDRTLISPTTAEKLLGDNKRKWEQISTVITRTDGKPSVAPESDKRPAISVTATAADFAEFAEKEND